MSVRQEESPLEVRRGQKGLTQQAVQDLTGVARSTIAAIENGSRVLTANLAEKLCLAFEGLDATQFTLEHAHWLESDLPLHTCTDRAQEDLGLFQAAGFDTRNSALVTNMVKTLLKGNNTVVVGGGLEFYVSPNILTNDNRRERVLRLQLQMNQLMTQQAKESSEMIPAPPSIVLSPKETKQLLATNEELGAKAQARQQAESGEAIPRAPSILLRDKEPSFEIKKKLARGPGVLLPTNPPLRTA